MASFGVSFESNFTLFFFWSREAATHILTQRNAILACISEYKWSWNVAEAHVQAVNVMYARQQVGHGRITRTRTENRPLLALQSLLANKHSLE